MASSSSVRRQKREVFLSFRGEDTRYNFTSHLHKALIEHAIDTFIDNNLERGNEISAALLKTIEESMISIVILSKDYASSSWCLEELSKILECNKTNGQIVIPIFYHVDPSDVRKQTGSFGEAFVEHEERFKDKVEKWRAALTKVGTLSGWHLQKDMLESRLIDDIINDILDKLQNISTSNHFEGLVGIDSRIEQIEPLLRIGLESTCVVVGIWGMAGIGKTTIARAIFNQIFSQFNGCCFLENVREVSEKHGVVYLKKELLHKILKDKNIERGTVDLENPFIYKRLGRKRVLIVLDDVNDSSQLESIIGRLDRFGKGSRIIMTTRNKQVLKKGVDEIYEVTKLNYHEALRLFCLNAFEQNYPMEEFRELSGKVINYSKCLPLALKVLGSFLFGRNKREWESALDKLKETPNMEIQKVLRISYDGLDQQEKNIFCDIACFFNGEDKDDVMKILDGCGLSTEIGIQVLIEKSLVTTSKNKLGIHDLLQEMGRAIVREASEEPGERSRLWNHEDVCHVLTKETGTKAVKGIFLDLSKISEVYLSSTAFKGMYNLRLLKFYYPLCYQASGSSDKLHFHEELVSLSDNLCYFHWERYPLKSLSRNFLPENLVELDLSFSKIEHLWEGTQPLFKLKKISLRHCKDLVKIPDLSKAPNLERVSLSDCESLLELHSSIQFLGKLKSLFLERCKKLTSLPSTINLKSLEVLRLNDCSNLKKFLEMSWNIKELNLSRIPMEDFPSIKYLFGISMQCLTSLNLNECNLLKIPDSLGNLSSLIYLSLSGNNFVSIPASIKHLSQLEFLYLCDCKRLQSLPELPLCLTKFRVTDKPHAMYSLYHNCFKLDQNSRSKIEAYAQLKIQLFAPYTFNEGFIPFQFVYPGSEIPEWFSYRNRGSLVTAKLPLHWANSKFIGFAVCAVVALENGYNGGDYSVDFKMKSYNGEYDILSFYCDGRRMESEHMALWYSSCLNEGGWFPNNYCYNEASFQFEADNCRVEKCGVRLLYAQDEDESDSESETAEDEDESDSESETAEDADESESERSNPSMIQSRLPNENFGVVDQGLVSLIKDYQNQWQKKEVRTTASIVMKTNSRALKRNPTLRD